MSESRNGAAVPYTAYKSKRSQANASASQPNAPRPSSRPSSFIGGDVWDKAQSVFGEFVKGAEDMGQEIFSGLSSSPNHPNGHNGSTQFSNVPPQPSYQSPSPQRINSPNGLHKSQSPVPSSPPLVPSSPSPPILPRSPVQKDLQPTNLTLENGLPSPPISEPDLDSEADTKAPETESAADGDSIRLNYDETGQVNGNASSSTVTIPAPTSSPGAGTSKLPPSPTPPPQSRKTSSFRYVPRPSPLNPNSAGHSRTTSTSSLRPPSSTASSSAAVPTSNRHSTLGLPSAVPLAPASRLSSFSSSVAMMSPSPSPASSQAAPIHDPPARTESLNVLSSSAANRASPSPHSSRDASPAPAQRSQTTPLPAISPDGPSRATSPRQDQNVVRASTPSGSGARAPYRPGFQPKGVYRPRTDDFIALRRQYREGGPSIAQLGSPVRWDTPLTRVERTKLERRLEKIIQLHFPLPSEKTRPIPKERRRNSSFFGSLSSSISSTLSPSPSSVDLAIAEGREPTKAEIRAAEQRITPWEEDSHVKACWICQTSFHPLTNRKHHCRLCGRIVCALPVSNKVITPAATESDPQPTPRPLRPTKCSSLFVVDTDPRDRRKIEEVGEGVDYGVKKHRATPSGSQQPVPEPDDDRFLKGVRVCRACRPVLLRAQYSMEMSSSGSQDSDLLRFYEALISLEKEIEEQLPVFHELLGATSEPVSSPELALVRKHLMESFAHYDAIAKKIAVLPYSGKSSKARKGKQSPSNHERVQAAIAMRARNFLEKNMIPLKKALSTSTSKPSSRSESPRPDAEEQQRASLTAKEKKSYDKLQPLLEQEALLESFVEQAQASRKFEDVKTLRQNLTEIRAEIERVMQLEGLEAGRNPKKRKGSRR